MKTPREFAAQWTELPMPARSSLEIATNNRDAEHRAELLKVQDDLLQGANREVMAEALIERLRGVLAEAKQAIVEREEKWNAIEEKRHSVMSWARRDECRYLLNKIGPAVPESNAPHDPTVPRGVPCPPALPPAESPPVCTACPGPALLGACSHPGCEVNKGSREVGRMMRENDKDGLATYLNRNVAAKARRAVERINAAPPDDIRERLDGLGRRISGLTADCDSDNRRIDDHERRLAALEAKGESGTHCCVAERCTEWRLP